MKKLMMMAALVAGALHVHAADPVTWSVKETQEENDISNPANWPAAFETDKCVQFTSVLKDGHYLYLSQDLEIASFYAKQTGEIVFDFGKDRTLTLTSGETYFDQPGAAITLRSGTIKTAGGSIGVGFCSGINNTFTVDGSNSRLVIPSGTFSVGTFQGTKSYNSFVLQNGAVADLGSSFVVGGKSYNRASACNRGEIKGEGTCLYMTNGSPYLIVGNTYIAGNGSSISNVLSVSDKAYVRMDSQSLDIGKGTQSNYNRAEFIDGATADLSSIRVGAGTDAYYNLFYASNATINASSLYVGYHTNAESNRFEISGGKTTIRESFYLGNLSSFCEGVIKDSANVRVEAYGVIGSSPDVAHSNRLEILSKSVVHVATGFRVGQHGCWNELLVDDAVLMADTTGCLLSAGFSASSSNNIIRVQNNGYIKADRFHFQRQGSCNNTLVLSNGVFDVIGDIVLSPSSSSVGVTNRLIFAGTTCVLRSLNASVPNCDHGIYEFRIPRGGYSEPPLQGMNGRVGIPESATFKLDISQFLRGGGGKQVLARGTFNLDIASATIESLNRQIAAQGLIGCSLKVVGRELILSTPDTSGTLIIIK